MRKPLHFNLRIWAFALLFLCSATAAWAQSNIGAITWNANGYYEIGSEAALEDLAVYVNGSGTYSTGGDETTPHDCADLTFKLTTDITLTGSHTAIGTTPADPGYSQAVFSENASPFKGTFDGVTYSITGLTINQIDADFQGLFGYISDGATIQNVTLNELNITGGSCVGGIAGCTEGFSTTSKVTIQNCHINGIINCAIITEESAWWHGGIVGQSRDYTDITNCTVTGAITINTQINYFYEHYYGGICGAAVKNTHISYCQNSANVTTGDCAGGIVGWDVDDETNSYSNCFSSGTIQVTFTGYGSNRGSLAGLSFCTQANSYTYDYHSFSNCYYYTTGNLKAFGDGSGYSPKDITGRGERVYLITNGANLSNVAIAEAPTYTTTLTGLSYYKNVNQANAWTLTLTPNWTSAYFERFTASNGTLTNPTIFDGTHQLYGFNQDVVIDADILPNIGAMTWNNTDQCFDIASKEALEDLAVYVNGKGTYSTGGDPETAKHDCLGMTFKLTQDITMTGEQNPIGAHANNSYSLSDSQFRGHFDGAGHSITNLTINHPDENYQGLFGYVYSNATIDNVTLVNCHITGKENTGGIVGYSSANNDANRTTIQNCHVVNGTITATQSDAHSHGGIVGYAYVNTTIDGCTVSGTISTVEACDMYGGIVGRLYSQYGSSANSCIVSNCENAANISGPGHSHGGIVGRDNGTNVITGCLDTGTAQGDQYYGAIIGYYYTYNNNSLNNIYASPCTNIKPFGNTNNTTYDIAGKGERAYRMTPGSHVTNIESDNAAFISHRDGLQVYFKPGDITLTLTADIPSGYTFTGYTCDGAQLSNATIPTGSHTMTMPKQDVVINANLSNSGAVDIADAVIGAIDDQRWKGNVAVLPTLAVTYNTTPLVLGTDYMVVYADNTPTFEQLPATATATIYGINGYTGSKSTTFQIEDFPLLDPTGTNSASNPYLVASEADIQALACLVNSGVRNNGYYKQTDNITLTAEHTPIGIYVSTGTNNNSGYDTYKFQGTYDGDNKNIEGLTINKSTTVNMAEETCYFGLFGYALNATIKNVNLVGCNVTAYQYVGGVAGYTQQTTITNCNVSGNVSGYCIIGGIVGNPGSKSTITYNNNNAAVSAIDYSVGGIVGYGSVTSSSNQTTVQYNNNFGSITGNIYVGGIVGRGYSYIRIRDNFNTGVVSGNNHVGSIIGLNNSTSLYSNYYLAGLTGGIGASGCNYGTDSSGNAEVVFTITAGDHASIDTWPTVTKVYNEQNYYKNDLSLTLSTDLSEEHFDKYTLNSGTLSDPAISTGSHRLNGVSENLTITAAYIEEKTDFSATVEIADIDDLVFENSTLYPEPEVTLGGTTLVKNRDFSYSYSADCRYVGTHTVTVTGLGTYTGSKSKDFNIVPFDLSNAYVTNVDRYYLYNGNERHPSPNVKRNDDGWLVNVGYSNGYTTTYNGGCIEPGDYSMTITGRAPNVTGEIIYNFSIVDYSFTTNDGTSSSYESPIDGSRAGYYQKSEFIIPAAQIGTMENKAIIGMNFHLRSTASHSWGAARFRVFMKEVANTTFTENAGGGYDYMGTDGATIVYDGALDGTQSKMFVAFDTPFVYHGGNLLIGFYEYQKGESWSTNFYSVSTSEVNSIFAYDYYSEHSLDDITTGNNTGYLPKTTFWYQDQESITVSGYTTNANGWRFIASPLVDDVNPTDVINLIDATPDNYDLYRLDPSTTTWENYKAHTNGFVLENGKGYLYAHNSDVTLSFLGTVNTAASKEVDLSEGWNLVGNPFAASATVDQNYYIMHPDGTHIEPTQVLSATAIPAYTGIIVQATTDGSITFTKVAQNAPQPTNSNLNIIVTQANTRDNAVLDKAIVSFNESKLGKFYFGEQNANIYIPQDGKEFAIVSADLQGEMPVNFKARKNGEFTISINAENAELSYLHLIDNIAGVDIDLLQTPSYSFSARNDDYASRFRLVFNASNNNENDNFGFISNGNLVISGIEGEATLQMIDVTGRILSTESFSGSYNKAFNEASGVYLIRLIQGENVRTQKIVVK